jgi:hypothetical protein
MSSSRSAAKSRLEPLEIALIASLAVACGGSTPAEKAERLGLANQLSGSSLALGGRGGEVTGQAGSAGPNAAPAPPPPMLMPAPPADPGAPSGAPQECDGPNIESGVFGTPAPMGGLLIDFSTYTPRVGSSGGTWGDTALGQITGGTSVYSVDELAALGISVAEGELQLSATLDGMGDYTGIVLWFTPCVNAAAFAGLRFPVRGELGGARLLVKPQTSPDYPVDVTNAKGKCEYPREDGKFTTCVQPTATIEALTENPVTLSWEEFVGGAPLPTTDPAQLLGFELQFQCQAASCALNISIGTVELLPPR